MRWLFVVAGWLIVIPAVQAQDAKKLYEAMEQKLSKAKVHKFDFDINAMEAPGLIKLKGSLILASGNRLKLKFEGSDHNQVMKGTIISDGTMMNIQGEFDGKVESKTKPVADKFTDYLLGYLMRAGLFVGEQAIDRPNPKDPAELKLSDFKFIAKEKIDNREANAIEYRISPAGEKEPATCKLWLDVKTNLPLKRVLEVAKQGGKVEFRVVETYTQWELDPKLPDGTFSLPK